MCGKVDPYSACGHGTHSHGLAPEPCGNGVSASIRRRRGWLDGMGNTCARSISRPLCLAPRVLVYSLCMMFVWLGVALLTEAPHCIVKGSETRVDDSGMGCALATR